MEEHGVYIKVTPSYSIYGTVGYVYDYKVLSQSYCLLKYIQAIPKGISYTHLIRGCIYSGILKYLATEVTTPVSQNNH